MNGFLNLFGDWHLYIVGGVYMTISAAIGAMPMPDSNSSKGYGWLFKFLNTLASNVSRAVASKIPGTDVMPVPDAQKIVNQVSAAAEAGAPTVIAVVPKSEQTKLQ